MNLGLVSRCFYHLKHSRTGERYEPGTAREVFGLWGLAGGATDDWYITQVSITSILSNMLSPTVQKHRNFHIILSRDRASHTATPLSCQSLTRLESLTDSFCRLQASSGYSVLNQYSCFNTKYLYLGAKYYCKQLPPGWETVDDWT